MPRSDGTVIIDTKIDMDGINRGTVDIQEQFGKIAASAKKLGALIGSVFAVREIVEFGKEASAAARELDDAMIGLQSIVEGQGKSFQQAKTYIDDYISDGLVPATNAINAYKNLAARGYDENQINQVMVALKDAASFGRQSSLSIGDAVQSATEGLKNENSVLVDNAGVTKNVAAMWEEYAASIGTTANNLTKQQKIQAEVQGILEETKFQLGDSAKVANTLSGQIAKLQYNLNNLKVAIGNVINPILKLLIPAINYAVQAVTKFANAVGSVLREVFGFSSEEVSSGMQNVADSATDMAGEIKQAGKEAKKYLAGFDEITKLGSSDKNTETDSVIQSGTGSGGVVGGETVKDNLSPQLEKIANKIKELVAPLQEIDFSRLKSSLGKLGESFKEFGSVVEKGLGWAWENILVPLAEWTIETAVPARLEFYANALELLGEVIETISPIAQAFWDNFLQPLAEWSADAVIAGFNWLAEQFGITKDSIEKNSDNLSENITSDFNYIAEQGDSAFIRPTREDFANAAAFIKEKFQAAATWISEKMKKAKENVCEAWQTVSGWFSTNVVEPVSKFFSELWNGMKTGAFNAWEKIKSVFSGIAKWLNQNVITPVSNGFRNMVNGVIGVLNALIRGVVSGINATVNALNRIKIDIPDWVPFYGGEQFGFNLRTITAPQIPYLAKGAVIPPNAPFVAMLGDQKHGTNIEAPLATIQEAVALVMEDMALSNAAGFEAIVSVLREILEAVLGIEVGDDVIGQAVERYNRKMAVVRGG